MNEAEAKEKIKEILQNVASNRYNFYSKDASEILAEGWDFLG